MDRISKALELAKRGRRPLPEKNVAEAQKTITYSHTRMISVDPEVLQRNRVISETGDKSILDAYKLLRTRVFHAMQQNQWVALGITSTGPNAGKTLTAINLAISLAMKQNYTVVLVDADLRRPSVHKYLGLEPELGLTDHLVNDVPVEDILLHPKIDRLVILPGKGTAGDSSELLSSPRMADLVQELKTRYPGRLVVFDLPPVLVGDDVVAFAPHLDAVMMIVEEGVTQSDDLTKVSELMKGVNIIGTVLNKSDEKTQTKIYDHYY
jgi:capsular exopolysaccharide synthesis family protein